MAADEPWHQSGLEAVLRCGVAFKRRILEREGRPPVTPIIRGSAVHRAIGATFIERIRSGVLPPVEMAEDIAAAEIDRARQSGATLTQDEYSAGVSTTFGLLKDEAVAYAGSYVADVAPAVNPVEVEERITVSGVIPGIELRGTIDLVDGQPDGEIVRDAKTSKRTPHADQADRSMQLTMYALLRSAKTKQPVTRVALDVMTRDPATGKVAHHHLPSTRTDRDLHALVNRVTVAAASVRAGIFLPANPQTDWWCSEKWCEFHATCPFALGRKP